MLSNRIILLLLILFAASASAGAVATNDYPFPPGNARAELSEDYMSVTVSWEPVGSTGIGGGYVDPSAVTYYIFDAFGSIYDPAIAVTQNTSYTFDYSSLEGQDFVAYQVTAGVGEVWYSEAAVTNIVAVGQPYTIPWTESFANRKQQYAWLIDQSSSWSASSKICSDSQAPGSVDEDGGYLQITPKNKGDIFGIISGKFDMGDAPEPTVTFDCVASANVVEVRGSIDGGEFTPLASFDFSEQPALEWTTMTVPLTSLAPSHYMQFELWYGATAAKTPLLIDRIMVYDAHDAGIVKAEAMAATNIAVSQGLVEVNCDEPQILTVVTVDGRIVYSARGCDFAVRLAPGFYLLRVGSEGRKILIP